MYVSAWLSAAAAATAATAAGLLQNPSCTAKLLIQMETNLCETLSAAVLHWDVEGPLSITSHCHRQGSDVQFYLSCHLLLNGKRKTPSFPSASIQWWRTKLPLSESVRLAIRLVTRHVCSLWGRLGAHWLGVLNSGDKNPYPAQSCIKTSPAQRANGERGWQLLPGAPTLCWAAFTRQAGFMLLWAQ